MSAKENKSTELKKASQNKEETDPYYKEKEQNHAEMVSWIASAEKELADLRLRKTLLEDDFTELLNEYRRLIVTDAAISTVAKTSLLAYLTYELLKPLNDATLKQTDSYNVWEAKYFSIKYQLTDKRDLALSFKMNVIDTRFESQFMSLFLLDLQEMSVTVDERQVLELIRLWYSEKVFSRNQLTLINYDLNRLLANFKQLGFTVSASLLDNTRALSVDLESDFPLETNILDDIFITAMDATEYDFDKIGQRYYQVKLNQEQNVYIQSKKNRTHLFIDSNNRRRSILDFFTHYPFFVPLIVRE
ncbi:MAG: hypothetical protein L0J33_08230 [Tetragenococcus halophilus]|uniref:hypothetical protein n=1 Tax=Tetragenococcus halophilus TaxID=51669 RepID=UPI00209B6577|nr:hypothetical protein [Tetragenococcus halophilus]MCO8291487.1 hypothetical protein [Tetragenococcus halophilus]MCO8295853.1 hypothetical protein [Tetragenococcus halophilus]MDN6257826.1 hypothetical protein [Tetragenococcus halophilus]MDN6266035.1 hypothetical protein [Tetragenococcus halophilus]MDN6503538.1 hypothetical protein [Tetragenococcus halophilus]